MMAPMHARRPALVSEEDFLALPESTQGIELIDGEVVLSPSPTIRHQHLIGLLRDALRDWVRALDDPSRFYVGIAPSDIRFAPRRILQTDVFVMPGPVDLDVVGPWTTIPLLCVEVVSSDRVYDRVTKRAVYGDAGVAEYWCVEQGGFVERYHGERLLRCEEVDDVLRTPVLPGFELHLGTLIG